MPIGIGLAILRAFGLSDRLARKFAPLALIGLAVLLLVLAVLAFNWWLDGREQAAVSADRAQSSAEAVSRARQADEAAQRASGETRDAIAAQNRAAAEAAAKSDDPLKAGLDELRKDRQ